MSWIHEIPVEEATGLLQRLFRSAVERAGRVWNITHAMSIHPEVMRDVSRLYSTLMMGDSPLTRRQREMLATVTSAGQGCHY